MSEKKEEIIRFYYFSEGGVCGTDATANDHQKYCYEMLENGYTLVSMKSLGGLDDRRDSYEGTIIYHWRLKAEMVRGNKEDVNNL
mgnify:FL=1|jgi:hypothetical protein